MFSVPVIGTDQLQQFSQLEISDIMEARIEEIFELVLNELKRMGVRELPGGYVLTGGVASTQGLLELARDVFQNRVRIAMPDYIGVREPQYTTAVGLIKFAYNNAKIQGRMIGSGAVAGEIKERHLHNPPQHKVKKDKQPEEKISSRVKRFFGYFFE